MRWIRLRRNRAEPPDRRSARLAALIAAGHSLVGVALAAALLLGTGLFFRGDLLPSTRVLAAVILLTSAGDLAFSLQFGQPRRLSPRKLASLSVSLILAIAAITFVLYLRSTPGGEGAATRLAFPLKGSWLAVTGGRSAVTNYHHLNPPAQSYAVDLVRRDGDSEGATVFAPLDGVVVEAIGNRTRQSPEAEGNLIIIRDDHGIDVWLAHLREGSVRVAKGDCVAQGQPVAQCGATGSADRAHLHIHAQRNGDPIPMVFGNKREFLLRNDSFLSP